jgi:hypothetical protein
MSMAVSAQIHRNRLGDLMVIVRDRERLHLATNFCHLGDGVAELLGHVENWTISGDSIDPADDQAVCDALRAAGITYVIYQDRGINLGHQGLADLVALWTV